MVAIVKKFINPVIIFHFVQNIQIVATIRDVLPSLATIAKQGKNGLFDVTKTVNK